MSSSDPQANRPRRVIRRGAALSLLSRNRDFRWLFFAQVVSFAGDWFLFVALVWLVYVLAGSITALGAVFQPASMAALPTLVDREDLGTANIMAGATWGTMLAVGSAIGGLVVAAFGRKAGYIGDAVSFFLSALLILRIRHPFAEPREPHHQHPGLIEATREAVQYARKEDRKS